MYRTIFYIVFYLFTTATYGQKHFNKFKKIRYQKVPITHGFTETDSSKKSVIDLYNVNELNKISITLSEIKNTDSSNIFIYSAGKLIQKFTVPYSIFNLANNAFVADINNDKRKDLKFFIYGTGNGLAGEQSTKIYLISEANKFKLISFFDFAAGGEFDLNNDGTYEILSCNHVYFRQHSYWVYNAFSLKNNNLVNISSLYNYPLWTKYLYRTSTIVAKKMTTEERMTAYKALPDKIIIY